MSIALGIHVTCMRVGAGLDLEVICRRQGMHRGRKRPGSRLGEPWVSTRHGSHVARIATRQSMVMALQ